MNVEVEELWVPKRKGESETERRDSYLISCKDQLVNLNGVAPSSSRCKCEFEDVGVDRRN